MLKIIVGILTTLSIIAGGLWGWLGISVLLVGATAAFLIIALRRESRVVVAEMEVAVVYKDGGRAFARFLEPGTHWISPFQECVEATISTAGQSTHKASKGIQAIGGLPFQIEWSVTYTLNPLRLRADVRPKMARALPFKADKIAQQHIENILHHVIGEYTLERLTEPGAHRKLERQVRQMAVARLEKLGFDISQVMIGAIHMPRQVMQALEAAQEREMQAENEARALERLQKVVSQFSEADMERLMELERIHTLGKNGVAMVYPTLAEQLGFGDMKRPAKQSHLGLTASLS